MTPTTTAPSGTASSTISETPGKTASRGGRPKDPNAKQVRQIALRPRDWEYLALWAIDSTNTPDNDSTRLERLIERIRPTAPAGPEKPFYTAPEGTERPVSMTPAIAREAKKQGMTKAEFANLIYAAWKERQK